VEVIAHTSLVVGDRSHVPALRQIAKRAAERVGFNETDAHRVGLVMTELATNVAKHAGDGGQVLLRAMASHDAPEVELVALDRGRGIANVDQSLADGHSTSGSAGTGLGAIRRLADEFDIYSQMGKGTAVLARLRPHRRATHKAEGFDVGGVSVAMPGENANGDAWTTLAERGRIVVSVVDGLGHGELAASASSAALEATSAGSFGTPREGLGLMHGALRHTRGAAAMIVAVDARSTIATAAGIGNVAAVIVGGARVRQAVSMSGILGHEVRQFREYQYPWPSGALLVVHSDGLISHWSLETYPGLRQRSAGLCAAVLYRDYQRGRDDVTVVVARELVREVA
jgi:anti-sigma regulatory factor (Ser/Thr protein kinase)